MKICSGYRKRHNQMLAYDGMNRMNRMRRNYALSRANQAHCVEEGSLREARADAGRVDEILEPISQEPSLIYALL